MASRISISKKVEDARANTKRSHFNSLDIKGEVKSLSIIDSYSIDANLKNTDLKKIQASFANPHLESAYIGEVLAPQKFDWLIEIGFLPGVTDNVGSTARETIEDSLKLKFKDGQSVYSSIIYFIEGEISEEDIKKIAFSLHNPLIQSARVLTEKEYKTKGFPIIIPKVKLKSGGGKVSKVDLNITDEKLIEIGKKGIQNSNGTFRGPLALDLDYMKAIQSYFKKLKRNPNDIELESLAQTWSEHCKHTIFADSLDDIEKGLYKTYIKGATNLIRKKKGKKDFCVSVFTDNAGAIVFDDQYLITHKVETHNTPSALDPFGGAITGIVGVNRDALGFGLGAKPVANTYGFCLAPPEDETPLYRDKEKKQKMLVPRRTMDGVIAGINSGGNCSGIPTALGFLYFDPRYRGKPLVFAGTAGLIPRKIKNKFSHEKAAKPGDLIVIAGGRVGLDGIHGATFSSETMDEGSPATAVQIGDPITQKKLSDALIKEARDKGLYTSVTDNGAGGISCSIAEMAKECGGAIVDLEKVPTKYLGMMPWQIWISESQERMTLSVPKSKWKEFEKLMSKRGVEARAIGEFTRAKKCIVKYEGKVIMDMEMEFLHEGLPKRDLKSVKPVEKVTGNRLQVIREEKDLEKAVLNGLSDLNIASTDFVSSQYDHEVQGSSVIKPIQGKGRVNADASVFRPVLTSKKGVVLSNALEPQYSEIDPYKMAAISIDSAIRSAVAAGADPDYFAILDNFCWCSSNEPERLWQLKEAVRACFDTAIAYETPFISGKDSMFNDFKGFDEKGNAVKISVPPTLLISGIGVIPDIEKTVSIDPKFEGDLVYILGETNEENVPEVNALKNRKTYQAFYKAVQKNLIASVISVGRGGLAVALPKMAIAGQIGLEIKLEQINGNVKDFRNALFSESQGRLVVTINPKNKKTFEECLKNIPLKNFGKVGGKDISIGYQEEKVSVSVEKATTAYRKPFKNF